MLSSSTTRCPFVRLWLISIDININYGYSPPLFERLGLRLFLNGALISRNNFCLHEKHFTRVLKYKSKRCLGSQNSEQSIEVLKRSSIAPHTLHMSLVCVPHVSHPAETQVGGDGAGRSGRLHHRGAAAAGGACVADGGRQPAPLWRSRLGQRHLGGAPSQHGSIRLLPSFTRAVNTQKKQGVCLDTEVRKKENNDTIPSDRTRSRAHGVRSRKRRGKHY